MKKSSKQGLLQGAITLTISMVAVKVIGAFFKIPLANIIGGFGMSYFSTAYDIFIPVYGIIASGLGVALARLIAETRAARNAADEQLIMKGAKKFFILVSIVCSVLMYFLARPISNLIGNTAAYLAVLAIIPAIPLSCVSAIYRGYFQGIGDMRPTAVSQVIEAVAKLVLGLGLAVLVRFWLVKEFEKSGTVAGVLMGSAAEAQEYMLRFTAAAAVFGISLSTVFGAYYVYRKYKKLHRVLPVGTTASTRRSYIPALIAVAVPISVSTLVTSLSGLIDLATVMNFLCVAVENGSEFVRASFAGVDLSFISDENLPEYLYGSYAGIAHSVAMLIPSVVGVLSVCTVPNVSAALSSGKHSDVDKLCGTVIRLTLFVAVPMGLVLFAKAPEILKILYPAREIERAIAAPILSVMGITAIFISLSSSLSAILQAFHKEKLPLLFMVVGAVIKTILNVSIVKIPSLNIHGVPYGSLVCYIVVSLCELLVIKKYAGGIVNVVTAFLRAVGATFVAIIISGMASAGVYKNTLQHMVVFFIVFVITYIIFSLFLGILHKDDIFPVRIKEKM